MSMSRENLYAAGFDVLSAALEAATEEDAAAKARAIASDFGADELRWLVTMLAVESTWKMRPRRSRRDLRAFIDRRRLTLMEHAMRRGDGPTP